MEKKLRKAIIELLHKAGERELRIIYTVLRSMLGE